MEHVFTLTVCKAASAHSCIADAVLESPEEFVAGQIICKPVAPPKPLGF